MDAISWVTGGLEARLLNTGIDLLQPVGDREQLGWQGYTLNVNLSAPIPEAKGPSITAGRSAAMARGLVGNQNTGLPIGKYFIDPNKQGMNFPFLHGHGLGSAAHQVGLYAVVEGEEHEAVAHQKDPLLSVADGVIGWSLQTVCCSRNCKISAVPGMENAIGAVQ